MIVKTCNIHGDLTLEQVQQVNKGKNCKPFYCKICLHEKWRVYRKKKYAENPAKEIARTNQWRLKNPDKHREHSRKSQQKHREKHPHITRERTNNCTLCATEKMNDSYIKKLLVKGTELKGRDIPPVLIELKRAQLQIKRKLRQSRKET